MKEYFDIPNLRLAWERCLRDTNRDVKDYAGIDLFGFSLDKNLEDLSRLLISGKYRPSRPIKFYEPKPSGAQRSKTILCIEDALVYQCIIDSTATKAYDQTNQYERFVFGSVLHPEVSCGLEVFELEQPKFYFFEHWMEKWVRFAESVNTEVDDPSMAYKLETDITGFFDCIPHSKLLQLIFSEYGIDKEVLDLLHLCLNRWSGTSDSTTPGVGIPQGPQASFFLANLYLTQLDHLMVERVLSYYRYMDDIRVYSSSQKELKEVLVSIDRYLKSNGLSINSKKTLIEPIGENREEEKIDSSDLLNYLGISALPSNPKSAGKSISAADKKKGDLDSIDLSEQFGSGMNNIHLFKPEFEFESKEEANQYLRNELKSFEQEVQSKVLFGSGMPEFRDPVEVEANLPQAQKEWLKLGYEYRNILNLSDALDLGYSPDPKYIDLWIMLSMKFLAKANQFNWILSRYPASKSLKQKLLACVKEVKLYEWIQHHFILTLTISQELTRAELRKCFQELKQSNSDYLRLSYYYLLISQVSTDDQLYATLNKSITDEENLFVKSTLLYYLDKNDKGQLSKHDIARTIGII